jgi:FkbM family methyltransferase
VYVNGRWGTTFYIAKDEYVGKSLHYYGEYNPDETEMILSLANGHCLDIGANFGVMGQALEYNGFKVTSFEPQPDVYNILRQNVRGECFNMGLGSTPGTFKMPKIFFGSKANYGGSAIGTRSDMGTIDVSVGVLDSFEFDDIGFMKIDVEGFEEKVLRGGVKTIERCRPIMYIEDDRIELSDSLRRYIRGLGYTIEEHQPTLYRENNYFGHKKNVWDKMYASHNLICRPC